MIPQQHPRLLLNRIHKVLRRNKDAWFTATLIATQLVKTGRPARLKDIKTAILWGLTRTPNTCCIETQTKWGRTKYKWNKPLWTQ